MRGLTITQVQVDEIWAFIGTKQKNVPADADSALGLGDCYTYIAIDPVTKLMPCYMLGYRSTECAMQFMEDLASRLANRVQLTTDGMSGYPTAVRKAFGEAVDYAVLNKTYKAPATTVQAARRYSPNTVMGIEKIPLIGAPVLSDVSTSHVERAKRS